MVTADMMPEYCIGLSEVLDVLAVDDDGDGGDAG